MNLEKFLGQDLLFVAEDWSSIIIKSYITNLQFQKVSIFLKQRK